MTYYIVFRDLKFFNSNYFLKTIEGKFTEKSSHSLCTPFEECSQQIVDEYSHLNLCPLNNSQAILIENGVKKELNV